MINALPYSSIANLEICRAGPDVRLSLPTLEEYVALTPRLVTPVCAFDFETAPSAAAAHT